MIAYDIICDNAHKFEGWFAGSGDFADQMQRGLLTCPVCNSAALQQMSAPAVRTSKNTKTIGDKTALLEAARTIIDYVEKNFDDVGSSFAEEARKIHYKESGPRNIRGTATAEETKELHDEGVPCLPLPRIKLDS